MSLTFQSPAPAPATLPRPRVPGAPVVPAPTPRLELRVGTAVRRYLALTSRAAGHRDALRRQGQPHPVLLRDLAGAGAASTSPARPRSPPAWKPAPPGPARVLQPDRAAPTCRGRARRAALVVDSPEEVAKMADVGPGASVLCGCAPPAAGRTGRCRASTAATGRGRRDPARGRPPRPRTWPASPSTSVRSSATPTLGGADRRRRPGRRRAARGAA